MSEQDRIQTDGQKRRKRVQLFKKVLIIGIIIAIILPIVLCTILFIRMNRLERQIDVLLSQKAEEVTVNEVASKEALTTGNSGETAGDDASAEEMAESNILTLSQGENLTEDDEKKKVYLTFDDGPSTHTADILDICKSYNVRVTFFVVGKTGSENEALYRRIVEEGHTLGMHSYSHKYNEIYESKDAFGTDLAKLQEYLYDITGTWSRIYRFPGGSSNTVSTVPMQELISYLEEMDITYYDWNISCGDAASKGLDARQIADNVIEHVAEHNSSMVLLHDAKDKTATVEALPLIIEALQAMDDVEIVPITADTDKIQHITSQNEMSKE